MPRLLEPAQTLAAQPLRNNEARMRPGLCESHWGVLLPEKLERRWTGAFKPEAARVQLGPSASAAGHVGLIQAGARQEMLAPGKH